jgi:protein-disulfide isomerase
VLGSEPQIIDTYVDSGQARLVYWPMLDHGNASLNAHAAADCVGRQSVDAFWLLHDDFYLNQGELWRADRDYFVNKAVDFGVDQAAFEECYDSGAGHATVTELDSIRRAAGIFNRPTFNINEQLLIGAQPFDVFASYIEAGLSGG